MERNLIKDKVLLALCKYAEQQGLKYYDSYDANEFKAYRCTVTLFNIPVGMFEMLGGIKRKRKSLKQAKKGIRLFRRLYFQDPHIGKLGISIEQVYAGSAVVNLLLSYKIPDPADIVAFIGSFQMLVQDLGFEWDCNIPRVTENIPHFDITVLDREGRVTQFCNPLNTATQGFFRGNAISEFYFAHPGGALIKLLCGSKYKAFYIVNEKRTNGHSALTILAKP